MTGTFVNQIMCKNVLTLDESSSLQESAKRMEKSGIGCMVVTSNDERVGIITERGFVTGVAAKVRPLFTEIRRVMSAPLITIDSKETIWEASELMKEKSIHKLPVKENGKIVGVLTATDIAKISSSGSDSEMRRICDQILSRMENI